MDNLQIKGKQGTCVWPVSIFVCSISDVTMFLGMEEDSTKILGVLRREMIKNVDRKTKLTSCQPLILPGIESIM